MAEAENKSNNQINRYYSQEDIQEILQLAISRQAGEQDKDFTYEQLMEIATELEISPDTLKLAEIDWQGKQGELQKRQEFNAFRRRRFNKRLVRYIVANSFFVAINFIASGGISWSLYVLLFWGLGVTLDALNTFQAEGEEYERAFQNWYRNKQLKQSFSNIINKFIKAALGS